MTTLDQRLTAAEDAAARAAADLEAARADAAEARQEAERLTAEAELHREAVTAELAGERHKSWPADHRGELDTAWQGFIDAVRDGGDAVAAWVTYRRTRVGLAHLWGLVGTALDAPLLREYEAARGRLREMNELVHEIGTAPAGVKNTATYTRLVDRWHELATEHMGPDHGGPRGLAMDKPMPYYLRIGRMVEIREGETFADALDGAVKLVEAEHRAEVESRWAAEVDKRAAGPRRKATAR